jgi:hypothetical protein
LGLARPLNGGLGPQSQHPARHLPTPLPRFCQTCSLGASSFERTDFSGLVPTFRRYLSASRAQVSLHRAYLTLLFPPPYTTSTARKPHLTSSSTPLVHLQLHFHPPCPAISTTVIFVRLYARHIKQLHWRYIRLRTPPATRDCSPLGASSRRLVDGTIDLPCFALLSTTTCRSWSKVSSRLSQCRHICSGRPRRGHNRPT